MGVRLIHWLKVRKRLHGRRLCHLLRVEMTRFLRQFIVFTQIIDYNCIYLLVGWIGESVQIHRNVLLTKCYCQNGSNWSGIIRAI